MNIYQYFYKPCYDTECNFTGLFGFMGEEKEEDLLAGLIQADNEYQAEIRAGRKEYNKLKKHFNYVTGVEVVKVIQIN